MSGVKLGGGESDLTIPECGLAIMRLVSLIYLREIKGVDPVPI